MPIDIDFSTRLGAISDLKEAYIKSARGRGAAEAGLDGEAHSHATATETGIWTDAVNEDQYRERCAAAVRALKPEASNDGDELIIQAWDDIVASSSSKKMGRYVKLVSHSRGRFSTVYKALQIPSEPPAASTQDDDDSETESPDWFQPKSKSIASRSEIEAATATNPSTSKQRVTITNPVVYALKVTMPAVMNLPHDSKREVRIVDHLTRAEKRFRSRRRVLDDSSDDAGIVPVVEAFRHDSDFFVIVFPFLPLNLQDLLDNARPAVPEGHPEAETTTATTATTTSQYQPRTRGPVLSQSQLRSCFADVFAGLANIHAAGVIHRDIKPSNILLRSLDGPAYITDFGISWLGPDRSSEPVDQKIIDIGTEQFRAPELLFGDKTYGVGVDLWAAGCVVAEAFKHDGKPLFFAGDLGSDLVLIHSIFTALGTPNESTWPEITSLPDWGKLGFVEYPTKPWDELLPSVPAECRDLVSKLVTYPRAGRISAEEALDHPFFRAD